jgi:hypothetical protein
VVTKKSSGITKREKTPPAPKSLRLAEGGINTTQQFAGLMSAIMTDVITGSVTPRIANATTNAAGKLLKRSS